MKLNVNIEIIDSQIENNQLGIPDTGTPEEAVLAFLSIYPNLSEECIFKNGFNFIIWTNPEDPEDPDSFYANAWKVNPETKEQEYIAYYEFKVTPKKATA